MSLVTPVVLDGNGYAVYGANLAQWGEVRLELNFHPVVGDNGMDPFDPYPEPEEIEVVNLTWSPTTYDRDGSIEVMPRCLCR